MPNSAKPAADNSGRQRGSFGADLSKDYTGSSAAEIIENRKCGRPGCKCQNARPGSGHVHCPAHEDRNNPNLSVSEGENGKSLVHCHAGCEQVRVIEALRNMGLWHRPVKQDLAQHGMSQQVSRIPYEQREDDGTLVAIHVRIEFADGTKKFIWTQPDGTPGLNGRKTSSLPLFNIHEVDQYSESIVVVEGEKCVERLKSIGINAVGTITGAGNPIPSDESLRSLLDVSAIYLWPDNDEAGQRHMLEIQERLRELGHADVRTVHWPDAPSKADAADFVDSGCSHQDVLKLLDAAKPVSSVIPVISGEGSPQHRFPIEAIPEPFRTFVEHGAGDLDCPAELVAIPLMVLTAGVIGNRFQLRIKRSWSEPAILWMAVVAPPGAAKTPAMKFAIRPFIRLQKAAWEGYEYLKSEYESDMIEYDKAKRRSTGPTPDKPKQPEPEHFYTTDATIEGLAQILDDVGGSTPGVTMIRDELVGWIESFDAYRRAGDRQNWMSLWAGMAIKVDRASKQPVFIERPAVSVVGGIQPDLLSKLEEEAGLRDGFLDRILFGNPETRPMRFADDGQDDVDDTAVFSALRAVRACHDFAEVALSPEARQLFRSFYDANAVQQESQVGLVQGYLAKLPGQLARLTLLLHCMAHPENPAGRSVSSETMHQAIVLVSYFQQQAVKVFQHFGIASQLQDPLSVRIVRALEGLGGSATTSELNDALGGHVKAGDRDQSIDLLRTAGQVVREEIPTGPRGGRPGYRYSLTDTSPDTTDVTDKTLHSYVIPGDCSGSLAGDSHGTHSVPAEADQTPKSASTPPSNRPVGEVERSNSCRSVESSDQVQHQQSPLAVSDYIDHPAPRRNCADCGAPCGTSYRCSKCASKAVPVREKGC